MIHFLLHPLRFFRLLFCVYKYFLNCKRQRHFDECQIAKWFEDNY